MMMNDEWWCCCWYMVVSVRISLANKNTASAWFSITSGAPPTTIIASPTLYADQPYYYDIFRGIATIGEGGAAFISGHPTVPIGRRGIPHASMWHVPAKIPTGIYFAKRTIKSRPSGFVLFLSFTATTHQHTFLSFLNGVFRSSCPTSRKGGLVARPSGRLLFYLRVRAVRLFMREAHKSGAQLHTFLSFPNGVFQSSYPTLRRGDSIVRPSGRLRFYLRVP